MTKPIDPEPSDVIAALGERPSCPSIETLAQLASGELSTREALAHRSHALECIRCSAELELAENFFAPDQVADQDVDDSHLESVLQSLPNQILASGGEATARVTATVPGPGPQGAAGWYARPNGRLFALAAMLLGLFGATVFLSRSSPLPQLDPTSSVRGTRLEALAPSGNLEAPPGELVWSSLDGAQSYLLKISRVDRSEVWSGSSRATREVLPTAVVEALIAGSQYTWSVTALDSNQQVVGASPATWFRVTATTGEGQLPEPDQERNHNVFNP